MDTIDIIKNSFEKWYNEHIAESKTSIAISYSDTQELSIKAYHKSVIRVNAITIKEGQSQSIEILMIERPYNHGVTSEEDAKAQALMVLLEKLYNYPL